jgi:hypothetical protein
VSKAILKQKLGKLDSIDNRMNSLEIKVDMTFEQVANSAETIHEIVAAQERHE